MSPESTQNALVIGAASAIAGGVITRLLDQGWGVCAVSRDKLGKQNIPVNERLDWFVCDYSEPAIANTVAELRSREFQFDRVFICNGILHSGEIHPEKRLDHLTAEKFEKIMAVNTLLPLLWIKHLKSILRGGPACIITTFSARIGSITDNRSGGWYAYRASKAALNMLLKTAAVEYRRELKNVRFLIFHPGTTDTPLSRPFQGNVPANKLFTPGFVATQLTGILDNFSSEESVEFRDWQNKSIPW